MANYIKALVDISDEHGVISWFEVIKNDPDRIHVWGEVVEVVDCQEKEIGNETKLGKLLRKLSSPW